MSSLFDPIIVGDIPLANRIVMAPLTRNRAVEGLQPGPLTVEYYRQRASAGLIIAEASQISPMAQGYLATPGIYTTGQVAAWRKVIRIASDKSATSALSLTTRHFCSLQSAHCECRHCCQNCIRRSRPKRSSFCSKASISAR